MRRQPAPSAPEVRTDRRGDDPVAFRPREEPLGQPTVGEGAYRLDEVGGGVEGAWFQRASRKVRPSPRGWFGTPESVVLKTMKGSERLK
ncbi:hypothetical protein GCM10022233_69850 [Streptomyces shaanxiensis]|uniref:Uncharacterized protein n=1 Tax=Streptomyces shaanxiensis TaxID=653357 RepID=A0ABP7W2T8_9ACTN